EILGALDVLDRENFLNRDSVLAKISFTLKDASFIIMAINSQDSPGPIQAYKALAELKFTDVATQIESRPRSSSFAFQMKLGSLHLKDCTLESAVYRYLVSPH